jgi:hypothetical protein
VVTWLGLAHGSGWLDSGLINALWNPNYLPNALTELPPSGEHRRAHTNHDGNLVWRLQWIGVWYGTVESDG